MFKIKDIASMYGIDCEQLIEFFNDYKINNVNLDSKFDNRCQKAFKQFKKKKTLISNKFSNQVKAFEKLCYESRMLRIDTSYNLYIGQVASFRSYTTPVIDGHKLSEVIHDDLNFNLNRERQWRYQISKNNSHDDFSKYIQKMAVAGEIAFEKICIKNGLTFANANVDGHYESKFDCIVEEGLIDVKTRNVIGNKGKRSYLNSDYVKKDEVIAFFINRREFGTTGQDYTICELVGILDPDLLKSIGTSTKNISFYNPCYFIKFRDYFNLDKKRSSEVLSSNLVNHYLFGDGIGGKVKIADFIEHYGVSDTLLALSKVDKFSIEERNLLTRLYKVSLVKTSLVSLGLYHEIINSFKVSTRFNNDFLSTIAIPACYPTQLQHKLLMLLVSLRCYLPSFRCKFTGDKLSEMDIIETKGTIYAKSKNCTYDNTLFTHSWYNGEFISIASREVNICELNDCACLVHHTKDKRRIGKKTCKLSWKPSNISKIKKVA